MKNTLLVSVCLIGISLFTGCAHKSYHPWLGEDLLVNDDRLAGVWQGDLSVGKNNDTAVPDKDLVIIRPVAEVPTGNGKQAAPALKAGYYSIMMIEGDALEEEATIEKPYVLPQTIAGGLYKVEDTYIAQLWGHTIEEKSPLVAPLYVIYRVEMVNDELHMFDFSLEEDGSDSIPLTDLLVEEGKDGPHTFFSKTEDLTAFIYKYHKHPSFFSEEPSKILKRIRDLRNHMVVIDEAIATEEELVPIPE